ALLRQLDHNGRLADWRHDLDAAPPAERWRLARDWVAAFAAAHDSAEAHAAWLDDAASQLALEVERQRINAELDRVVDGLLGEHARIVEGRLRLNLNDFWQRHLH